jgi:hypothetical protein
MYHYFHNTFDTLDQPLINRENGERLRAPCSADGFNGVPDNIFRIKEALYWLSKLSDHTC